MASATEPQTFVVAVDGSEDAHDAFLGVLTLVDDARHDRVVILHVAAPGADETRVARLADRYDTDLVTKFPKDRYEVVVKNKKEGQNTHDLVCDFVNHYATASSAGDDGKEGEDDGSAAHRGPVHFLATGFVGRKGMKEDPSVLGSTADYALRNAMCSSIIVKRAVPMPKPPVIVAAVDGSDAADFAVQDVLKVVGKDGKITVLYVDDPAKPLADEKLAATEAKYAKLAAENPQVEWKTGSTDRSKPVGQVICDLAEDMEATLLAIGCDGMSAMAAGKPMPTLGSTTHYCVRHCRMSVLCSQRSGIVYGK